MNREETTGCSHTHTHTNTHRSRGGETCGAACGTGDFRTHWLNVRGSGSDWSPGRQVFGSGGDPEPPEDWFFLSALESPERRRKRVSTCATPSLTLKNKSIFPKGKKRDRATDMTSPSAAARALMEQSVRCCFFSLLKSVMEDNNVPELSTFFRL